MVSLSSRSAVLDAIGSARSVLFSAYTLQRGAVFDALAGAARRGARVTVRLEGRPYGDAGGLARSNGNTVAALKRLGADAALVDTAGAREPMLHAKAAVCDGVAYLDDRNFVANAGDTIVRDDTPGDVRALADAVQHRPAAPAHWFWTTKRAALEGEAALLDGAANAKTVDVETESFGLPGGVYAPLKRLAAAGVACRLIVSPRYVKPNEAHVLDLLRAAGVAVRLGTFNEKLAVVDGAHAWTGSANSSCEPCNGDDVDWGLRTDAPDVVGALASHFNAHWTAAKPLETRKAAAPYASSLQQLHPA